MQKKLNKNKFLFVVCSVIARSNATKQSKWIANIISELCIDTEFRLPRLLVKSLAMTCVIFMIIPAFAMPPKPGVYNDDVQFVEKTKILFSPSTRKVAGLDKSISYYNPYSEPKINPLFVLVDFTDKKFSAGHDKIYYDNLLYATSGKSLKTFYLENSGGKFEIIDNGYYLSVMNNPNQMRYYGEDYDGKGSDNQPELLAVWVAQQLDAAGFDLSKFDSNGDKIVDALIIIHSGNGQEGSGISDDIWSFKNNIKYGGNSYYQTASGYKIIDYMMLAETSPLGTFCHEFGHILGLPDFYNTASGSSNAGKWSLMDAGGWTDNGNTPSHLCAWCKTYLGFGNTKTISDKVSNLKITPTEKLDDNTDNTEFYRINILDSSTEYFLVEYRNQTGFDSKLPDKGMLVWHIDEDLLFSRLDTNQINTGSPHNSVELVEADGSRAGFSADRAEASDLFRDGNVFDYPYNKSFSGENSNIVLNSFDVQPDYMQFSSYVLKASDAEDITEFFNYPNPIKNAETTFKLTTKSPISGNAKFKIYDISGKLIYTRDTSSVDLDSSSSSDYNFVYKFKWDCKDIKNDDVASGIYIYFIKIGSIRKTGKLAVLK